MESVGAWVMSKHQITLRLNAVLFALLLTGGGLRFILGIGTNNYYPLCITGIGLITAVRCWGRPVVLVRQSVAYLTAIVSLSGWLLLSLFWTVSQVQYQTDLQLLLGIVLTVLLLIMNWEPGLFAKMLDMTVFFTLVIAVYVVTQTGGAFGFGPHGVLPDELYLTAGRLIAIGYLIGLIRFLTATRRGWGWFVVSSVSLAALAVSEARGPLLFSIGISGLLLALAMESRQGKLWLRPVLIGRYLLFLIPMLVIVLSLSMRVDNTRLRLLRIFSVANELREGGRGAVWERAWESIVQAPYFGYGLGSSGLMSGGPEDYYPHNWLLQIWLDGGLPGVAALLWIVLSPLLVLGRRGWQRRSELIITGACYLLLVLEYSKSHNCYIARDLFCFGAALLLETADTQGRRLPDGADCGAF